MQLNYNFNTLNQVSTGPRPTDNYSTVIDKRQQAQLLQQENKSEQANQGSRFDVDQQTLLLLEQQQKQTIPQQSVNKQQNTLYDQPLSKNQTAVAAYQTVDNIAQRASIKQSFGINLIA